MKAPKQYGPVVLGGGTLTNTTFKKFRLHGKTKFIATDKSTLSGEEMDANPKFATTRKINNEYRGVMKVYSKILRSIPNSSGRTDLSGRSTLMSIVHQIKNSDTTGVLGYRDIMLTTNSIKFRKVELNEDSAWSQITSQIGYSVVRNADKTSGTLTIPSGTLMSKLKLPECVDAVKIWIAATSVSDYTWVAESGSYEPVNGTADGLMSIQTSDFLDLDSALATDLELTTSLGDADMESCLLFFTLGLDCYMKIGTNYTPLYSEMPTMMYV